MLFFEVLEQNDENLERSYANGRWLRARANRDITTRASSHADVTIHGTHDAESGVVESRTRVSVSGEKSRSSR